MYSGTVHMELQYRGWSPPYAFQSREELLAILARASEKNARQLRLVGLVEGKKYFWRSSVRTVLVMISREGETQ